MTTLEEHYEILGLQPSATIAEVKRAYKELAQIWHPDRFPNNPQLHSRAEEHFKKINNAKDAIISKRRAAKPAPQTKESSPKQPQPKQATPKPPPASPPRKKTSSDTKKHEGLGVDWWVVAAIVFILFIVFRSSNSSSNNESQSALSSQHTPYAQLPADTWEPPKLTEEELDQLFPIPKPVIPPSTNTARTPVYIPDTPVSVPNTNAPNVTRSERIEKVLPQPTRSPNSNISDYRYRQKQQNIERSVYWADRGYTFDPDRMTAYSMDQKVKDIERAKYWKARGYSFNAKTMTAYSMDQKVKDIDRSRYWKRLGYDFNPQYMTAYSMNQKVKDIERANYWKDRGYNFNPKYVTAYSMNQKVKDYERAKYWKSKGYVFDPEHMTAYSMDREAEKKRSPNK